MKRVKDDLTYQLGEANKEANALIDKASHALPQSALEADTAPGPKEPDVRRPHSTDCGHINETTEIWIPASVTLQSFEADKKVVPPYLAMFIANAYAALGQKDSALRILNAWIRYYGAFMQNAPSRLDVSPSKWFYDRALLEYGVLQESNEPYPTTPSEHFYLRNVRPILAKDWGIDLNEVRSGSAEANIVSVAHAEVKPDTLEREASARLFDLYSDVVQRLLHAALAVRSEKAEERIEVEEVRLARGLISSSNRRYPGETDEGFRYRQVTNQIEGGRLLAQWSIDGPRAGQLRDDEVRPLRLEALKSLVDALPMARELNKDEEQVDEGPIRKQPGFWDPYRRLVEQEVLDLEGQLGS